MLGRLFFFFRGLFIAFLGVRILLWLLIFFAIVEAELVQVLEMLTYSFHLFFLYLHELGSLLFFFLLLWVLSRTTPKLICDGSRELFVFLIF